jgi:hypothetical protein
LEFDNKWYGWEHINEEGPLMVFEFFCWLFNFHRNYQEHAAEKEMEKKCPNLWQDILGNASKS